MTRTGLAIAVLALTLANGAAAVTPAAERKAIAGLHAAQETMIAAVRDGDVDALVSCYSGDAELTAPLRPTVRGRDAIRDQMEYTLGLGVRDLEVFEDDLFVGDDHVVQRGVCVFYDHRGREISRARFLTVWRDEGDAWRIYRDFVV